MTTFSAALVRSLLITNGLQQARYKAEEREGGSRPERATAIGRPALGGVEEKWYEENGVREEGGG